MKLLKKEDLTEEYIFEKEAVTMPLCVLLVFHMNRRLASGESAVVCLQALIIPFRL